MTMKKEDAMLVAEFQGGNQRAFDELASRYKRRIYGIAYKMTDNHEDALDVSQEVFIRVYKSISKFKGRSSFNTWLYRITVNYCINYLKNRSRHKHLPFDETMEVSEGRSLVSEWWSNPQKALENKEFQQDLAFAIGSLPVRQRTVFVLRHLEGLSHKEIAGILRCSIGNVKANLFRAIRKLRDRLKEYVEG